MKIAVFIVAALVLAIPTEAPAEQCKGFGLGPTHMEICGKVCDGTTFRATSGDTTRNGSFNDFYVNEQGGREDSNCVAEFSFPDTPSISNPQAAIDAARQARKYRVRIKKVNEGGGFFQKRGDVIYEECSWNPTQRGHCIQLDFNHHRSRCWRCGSWIGIGTYQP